MKDINLIELYKIKKRIIKENLINDDLYNDILEAIKEKENMLMEDTGMGAVVSSQPSSLPGSTVGMNWSANGGTVGSGDVSFPYNPSGGNKMTQNVSMGRDHGARTGKKSRVKKLDLKALKSNFSKRQDYTNGEPKPSGEKKVMDFNDFVKKDNK